MRPTTKQALLEASESERAKLRGSTLGSFFVSCTSSHYAWGRKTLKATMKAA